MQKTNEWRDKLLNNEKQPEGILLDVKGFCNYLGIGQTKARELLRTPRNGYAMKIGSKWYVHKERLDAWLLEQCNKY